MSRTGAKQDRQFVQAPRQAEACRQGRSPDPTRAFDRHGRERQRSISGSDCAIWRNYGAQIQCLRSSQTLIACVSAI